MLRAVLIFLVGALVGANAVYFLMTRGDRCARCEMAASITAQSEVVDGSIAAPSTTASTAAPTTVVPSTPSPPVPSPVAPTTVAPPPVSTTPLPTATTGSPALVLGMPLPGLKPGQLHDTFNEARGGERHHEALDILAPAGTPVLAVADGHIQKLFTSVRGGFTIYQFEPSGRYAYYYAHLQRYAPGLAEGKAVKRGQVIGYVGSSGNANPAAPHLHFAVFELGPERQWWKGTPINPYPLLGGVAPAR